MARKVITIALNGVTGRMGYRQHLVRSLLAIRDQGGVLLPDGSAVYPEPVLVGRDEGRLRDIAARHDLARWSTSLDEVLSDPDLDVYFDSQVTSVRAASLDKAMAAGKHVYTERPVAGSLDGAVRLAAAARDAGITNGGVQDKLFRPGMIKLRRLVESGFFGRVLAVRLEFGYWVFEGDLPPAQRPSWNYREQDGGGIVLDMFPHWQYLLEDLFGPIAALYARRATHLPRRWDESGQPYEVTADDAAYAGLEVASGAFASVNSSSLGAVIALRGRTGVVKVPDPGWKSSYPPPVSRSVYAAAHVAAFSDGSIDWDATMAFREHLWRYGFGVAEAMDTAQRGMGLGYGEARELIARSAARAAELGMVIASGAGTDQLAPGRHRLAAIVEAYADQVGFVQDQGSEVIVMASRALAASARSADGYLRVDRGVLKL